MGVTVVAVALLTACTGEPPEEPRADAPRVVQPGAPGEPSRELTLEDLAELDLSQYSDADVAFMQGMMLHHVQAVRMVRLVPERTSREDVPLLARRIDLSQEAELEQMRQWLIERGEPVPSLLATHDHGTPDDLEVPEDQQQPGMLTEAELQELEGASGEEFDRLFLEGMLRHHEGALTMVDDLFASDDGGLDVGVTVFANHVYADQRIEIGRLQRILDDLDEPG